MGTTIRVLDDKLIDKIAAGEVVERPASVVKELIENALDAGARSIQIDLVDGGRALIRVSDDGLGMERSDALLSVQRHATSKLSCFEDLIDIQTLGFRGEALPSIAAVSRFSMKTRPKSELVGTELHIEGGAKAELSETGCAPGTTVEVAELFFNVPARRKFLKARQTETSHILEICLKHALAKPHLRLSVTSDGRQLRQYTPCENTHQRLQYLHKDVEFLRIETERQGVKIRASLSAPEHARAGARQLHLFVNGRPIVDHRIARAIAFAYGDTLPPGRYPIGSVELALPPGEVDINVHPHKTEVRFARHALVMESLTRALATKLGSAAWTKPKEGASFWGQRLRTLGPQINNENESPSLDPTLPQTTSQSVAETRARYGSSLNEKEQLWPKQHRFSNLRVLTQSTQLFLICENDAGLFIIDQHAAHERLLYQRYRESVATNSVRKQSQLFPARLEGDENTIALWTTYREEIEQLGFEVSELGPHTLVIHAIPILLSRAESTSLLREALQELDRQHEKAFEHASDTLIARLACAAALRRGDALSIEDAQRLVSELVELDTSHTPCPHAQPVVFELPFSELEARLGR